ncbi:Com family DNA-binding transcriptional regulator [Delftia sp. ZNC0008]|uniref:Com family DNA-binding transcriptional regulator n=2 Tax=Burkholderiales TaxID=80840 RepID=UPI002F4194B7
MQNVPASPARHATLARAAPAYRIFRIGKVLAMEEIRCGSCRRKLAEGEYTRLSIKCPRCGAFNQLSASSAPSELLRGPTAEINDKPHSPMDRRQAPPRRPAPEAVSPP